MTTLSQRIYNGTWPSSDRFANTGGPELVPPVLLLQPRTADTAIYDYGTGNYSFSAVVGPALNAKSILKGYKSIAIPSGGYLLDTSGVGLNPGGGDFTIEMAFRTEANCPLLNKGDETANDRGWQIEVSAGGGVMFRYSLNGTSYVSVGGGTYGSGSNALVVVERAGGTLNVALNGVQVGTNTIGAGVIRSSTDSLVIGGKRGSPAALAGHLYALRISLGTARYPIAALPARLTRPFPTYNPSVWA